MNKGIVLSLSFLVLVGMSAPVIWAQDDDYGDAPEGAIAYPSLGVTGQFPTCMNVPISGFVQHGLGWAHFGPTWDPEIDGNQGFCPTFAPYDNDECYMDGDAGLIIPDPYTTDGISVFPCPASAGFPLGLTCSTAVWGANVDIDVTNNMPVVGYANVVFDWNQNGVWGDLVNCPGVGTIPEHVLVDFPVPMGFAGPLSIVPPSPPPNFVIGPNFGFVWARFMISEAQVGANWNGQGIFEDGESEDYLIEIAYVPDTPTPAVTDTPGLPTVTPTAGGPTPTPTINIPATGPAGVALLIVTLSGLLAFVSRKRK
ncbi:hypothetical protein JXA40_10710 [bacterium]|nr:hypothetical protein [candidate division CSSED10-310 bacterium]